MRAECFEGEFCFSGELDDSELLDPVQKSWFAVAA